MPLRRPWRAGRTRYARVLADYAGRVRGTAALVRFGGDEPPLAERVRRLLSGGYHPRSRLPVYTLLGGLAAGLLCLGLVCVGTSLAVGRVLTPQERVARLTEAEDTHGWTAGIQEDVRVPITGSVRTEDGTPVPEGCRVPITSERGSSGYTTGARLQGTTFSATVPAGAVTVAAVADGYAPAIAGPRLVRGDGEWTDVQLVLGPGIDASARLTDESGAPVPNARVSAGQWYERWGVNQWSVASDAQGMVPLEHLNPDMSVRLQILAPGHQYQELKGKLAAGQVKDIVLRRAAATTGVIVDRDSGRPVPGAEVYVVGTTGPVQHPLQVNAGWMPADRLAAVADSDGRFSLTSLRDDCTYSLMVREQDHSAAFVNDVRSGKTDLRVALGPFIYVKGTVTGPLDVPAYPARGAVLLLQQPVYGPAGVRAGLLAERHGRRA